MRPSLPGLSPPISDYDDSVPKITFLPSGATIEVHEGATLFNAAPRADVAIPSQCGGRCACALCRVEIVEGAEFLSPLGWDEEEHLGNTFHLTKERLSCQCRVFGDVVVKVVDPPVREKARGRFVPRALMKKREDMERQEEMHRVRSSVPGGVVGSEPSADRQAKRPERPEAPKRGPKSRVKRSRGRNPGAPRRGDSRPPPGAKKDED
jgi:ferredoxin